MKLHRHYQFAAVLLCAALVACSRADRHAAKESQAGSQALAGSQGAAGSQAPTPADAAPVTAAVEWYRAAIGSDAEEVPFFLGAPPPATAGDCTIVNGEERIKVPCSWDDASTLEIEFPTFATSIQATRGASGALQGTWQLSRISGVQAPAPFAATKIASPDPHLRFVASAAPATPASDFAGTWKFEFDEFETGKGMFAQTPDGVVTGTIIPRAIGDMRYLAGNAHGNTLLLSTFDGQHAYVVRAQLDAQGTLKGAWIFSHVMTDRFTARRVPELDIAVTEKIRLRRGARTVTVPQLEADSSLRGKPVIVDYFGTWCPACIDQTPFLVELYRRYHAQGLEILSIALESTTDDAYNQRQIEVFRKHYAIPWRIIVVPGDYADSENLLPPELEGTGGYPVTMFLDRDRTVRAVHSGFIGPAAGDEHQRLIKIYDRHVQGILASPAPAPAPAPPAPAP